MSSSRHRVIIINGQHLQRPHPIGFERYPFIQGTVDEMDGGFFISRQSGPDGKIIGSVIGKEKAPG